MRPRKPDETLNRHGLGARRVALLAPRGVFGKYRHPLGYVGAITKIYVKFKSKSRILGDGKPQGVPAECIFGRGKGAAVRQMSGEVCAAAKVSECCDAVGEESRNLGSPQSTTAKRGHFVGFQ